MSRLHRRWPLIAPAIAVAVIAWLFLAPLGPAGPSLEPLAFPAPVSGDRPPSKDPWQDPAWLVTHFELACQAVEAISRTRFRVQPSIRVGTKQELADLYLDADRWRRRMLGKSPPTWGEALELARGEIPHIGRYFTASHTVMVAKCAAERCIWGDGDEVILTPDVLRIILVHEAAHALDLERFAHLSLIGARKRDEHPTYEATLEGHAQHVARIVAERWGIPHTHEFLREMYRSGGKSTSTRSAYFQYVTGQDFMDRVHEWGGRAAVDAALRDPPSSIWHFVNPRGWFEEKQCEDLDPRRPSSSR